VMTQPSLGMTSSMRRSQASSMISGAEGEAYLVAQLHQFF